MQCCFSSKCIVFEGCLDILTRKLDIPQNWNKTLDGLANKWSDTNCEKSQFCETVNQHCSTNQIWEPELIHAIFELVLWLLG